MSNLGPENSPPLKRLFLSWEDTADISKYEQRLHEHEIVRMCADLHTRLDQIGDYSSPNGKITVRNNQIETSYQICVSSQIFISNTIIEFIDEGTIGRLEYELPDGPHSTLFAVIPSRAQGARISTSGFVTSTPEEGGQATHLRGIKTVLENLGDRLPAGMK